MRDPRGVFVEMLKTPDCGQFSYFTAHPGITRGEHYHHTKTEKFLVIQRHGAVSASGISRPARRYELVTTAARTADCRNDSRAGPTTSPTSATTNSIVMLWANEIFDRERPDTVSMKVEPREETESRDRRRYPAGDHPAVARDGAAGRALRSCARAHRPELRLRAERDLLRGSRRSASPTTSSMPPAATRPRRSATSSSPSDRVLAAEQPEAMLILGDTNSCLAVIPAKRRKIPIFHMEAGNRCFDQRVPEETNRRIVDHTADVNLTYSSIARDYLLREGLPPDLVIKTGSPMFEVLTHYRDRDRRVRRACRGSICTPAGFFVVSAHREENIDSAAELRQAGGRAQRGRRGSRPAGHRFDASANAEAHRGEWRQACMPMSGC